MKMKRKYFLIQENLLNFLQSKYTSILKDVEFAKKQRNNEENLVHETLVNKEEESKNKMINILKLGEVVYDYLRNEKLNDFRLSDLEDHVERLVEYLIKDKQYLDEKYKKLLDLHNNLIEENQSENVYNTPEYIYKITDENELLKEELRKLRDQNNNLKTELNQSKLSNYSHQYY